MSSTHKLLGNLNFVSRTFEGGFKETPFVLDTDANLYIGPADQFNRDEHATIEVVFQFLRQTERVPYTVGELLRDRTKLLGAFRAFDQARVVAKKNEFRIYVFGTYDGELLEPLVDDELPAGPCGQSVNDIKRRLHGMSRRLDPNFTNHSLGRPDQAAEARFLTRSTVSPQAATGE